MKPESCSFTQTCHAANWLFSTRGTSTRGLHRSSSPAISRLRGQPQPQGTPNHSSAISLQTVPQRSTTSHASVAEAPIQNEAFEARHADKSAKSSSNNRKTQKQSAVQTPASQQNQLESLGLLEWPELCQQVASFTSTAVAAEIALAARLPMAATQQQAEQLLQETAEAQQANLALKGIHDLRGLLEAVGRDRVLQPIYLDGVASSLEIAAAVAHRLQGNQNGGQEGAAQFPALQHLGRGIKDALPQLRQSIRHCIEDGRVLDRASERLGIGRRQRRDNMQSLRQGMNEWARNLASQNVSEEALVVIRRDRLCVPVKAGRQSQLPKGSISLAVSASGSTVYMEPAPMVALNNAEAMLRAQEQEEEESILAQLSVMVKKSTVSLQRMMKAVTALDIAMARAKHATWLSGKRPVFLSAAEASETGCMHALGVFHPLLLEPSLPPLKEPPATEAVNYDAAASPGSSAVADSMGKASWEPQQPPRQMYGQRGRPKGKVPCPVDLLVPAGVKVVAVTGPNTGGKTASLKTLGLTAIMAKAGLFIPTAHPQAPTANPPASAHQTVPHQQPQQQAESVQQQQPQQAESIHQQQQQHPDSVQRQQQQQQQTDQPLLQQAEPEQQHEQPKLVFFDKVLADVGDSQNLQQSLSTFSGHIRRVRTVLQEATPQSLVLLDEVGSGTDPGEGAALAGALLDKLADTAGLTYATTHHAQLKDRPASDARFINASVEFDLATLKPTYRLLWGQGGLSNALAVAEGLGFDPLVVQRAREIATHGQEGSSPHARAEELKQSLEQELLAAQQEAAAAAAKREAAEKEMAGVQAQAEQLAQQQAAFKEGDAQLKTALQAAQTDLDWIVSEVRAGKLSPEEAEDCIKDISDSVPSIKAAAAEVKRAESRSSHEGLEQESAALRGSGWSPKLNELVRLLKLGERTGKVVRLTSEGVLTVKVGARAMQTHVADVAPTAESKASRAAAATFGKAGPQKSRAGRQGSASSKKNTSKDSNTPAVNIQLAENTIDVRGQATDDALAQVEAGLDSAIHAVMFVVHGVGTGKLRSEVHQFLRRNVQVAKFSLEKDSGGGCTVVYLK